MTSLLFCAGTSIVLRGEYLLAREIVQQQQPEWNPNKVRIFTVRVVSFTHAFFSALGCLFSLLTDWNYIREPYDYHKPLAEYVFLFSTGYFIYDLLDMYFHDELNKSKEYLIHHSLVITAFTIIFCTGKLFGLAMITLLVEVQTIFLHLRTMVRLLDTNKKNNKHMDLLINANFICLFLFRHIPVCWAICFLLFTDEKVPGPIKLFLLGGYTFLEYHNTHLTVAMAQADGFFGCERQTLTDDHCDPLGSVKSEKKKE